MLRDAVYNDLDKIVGVHILSFQGFFLTFLGESFLKELYKSFIDKESGILRVVCNDSGDIVGFSAGTVLPGTYFSQLKRERGAKFVFLALPSLIKKPIVILKKLYGAVFYRGDTTTQLSRSALLSSVAVHPKFAGKSFGKMLIKDFEVQVEQSRCCDSIYLITDHNDNQKVISFYLNLEYETESTFYQTNNRKMLRLVKRIN